MASARHPRAALAPKRPTLGENGGECRGLLGRNEAAATRAPPPSPAQAHAVPLPPLPSHLPRPPTYRPSTISPPFPARLLADETCPTSSCDRPPGCPLGVPVPVPPALESCNARPRRSALRLGFGRLYRLLRAPAGIGARAGDPGKERGWVRRGAPTLPAKSQMPPYLRVRLHRTHPGFAALASKKRRSQCRERRHASRQTNTPAPPVLTELPSTAHPGEINPRFIRDPPSTARPIDTSRHPLPRPPPVIGRVE